MEGYLPLSSGGTAAGEAASQHALLNIDRATGHVRLPQGDFAHADFTRSGPDLLIETADGGAYVVPDYFMAEISPPLITHKGMMLSAKVVTTLAGPLAPDMVAQAVEPGQAAQQNNGLGEPIGQISESEGQVTVTHANGDKSTLTTGDSIFQGDILETASGASVGVIFVDDTVFSLDEGGRMVMDEMVYDPDTQSGVFNAQVVQGVFSFVSGQVAKTSPDGMVVSTPTNTIGIRGSTVMGKAAAEGEENTITLAQDVDGNVGEITVSNGAGTQVLNQPGASTSTTSFNTPPAKPTILSAQDIQQNFGSTLTKLTKVVSQKAQQDAQQAEEKAQKSEEEAKQAEEEAKQSEAEAAQASEEAAQAEAEAAQADEQAAQAEAEAEAAQAEAEAAKAEAEATGNEEAVAKAAAAEAKAAEAAQKAEAVKAEAESKAQEAQQQKAEAESKAQEAQAKAAVAETRAAEAQAAQSQAQQAQQFSKAADSAFTQQAQTFTQVQQQQAARDPAADNPAADNPAADNPAADTAQTAQTADAVDPQNADAPPPDAPTPTEQAQEPLAPAPLPAQLPTTFTTDSLTMAPVGANSFMTTLAPTMTTDPLATNILTTDTTVRTVVPITTTTTTTTTDTRTTTVANSAPGSTTLAVTGDEDTAITGAVRVSDANNDALTYSLSGGASHGSVAVGSDGTFTYTPTADISGTDSFTVAASDGKGGTSVSTVDVTVNAVNDAPTAGGTLSTSLTQGGSATLQSAQLSATDVDNATSALTYTVTAVATNGALKLNGTTLAVNGTFTQADVDAGYVTYVNGGSAASIDSVTFTVSDGTLATTAQTFSLAVTALPSGTYTIASGETLSIAANVAPTAIVNNGTLNVTAGTISTPTTVTNNATLNMTGGTFSTATLTNASGGVINYSGAAALASTTVNNGTINVTGTPNSLGAVAFTNNGVLDIAAGVVLIGAYNYAPTFASTSSIQGNGTFKTAVQAPYAYNAIWNPGTNGTVGTLTMDTWDANYSRTVNMSSTTVLNIDVAGTTTGQYDKLVLTTAYASTINGTLNFNSIGSYTPTSGDTFTVLTYTTGSTGSFTITDDLGAGWNILATYGGTALTLTVLDDVTFYTVGTAGNDTLTSLASNDTINGGAGTDVLNLNGAMAHYTWAFNANGVLTLTDGVGTDGTDTISNIETLKFTDGAVTTNDLTVAVSSDYALASSATNLTSHTMEAWVKTSTPSDWGGILSAQVDGSNFFQFVLSNTGVPRLQIFDTSGASIMATANATASVSNGQWHHVAYSYDATTGALQFYVDGVADGAVQNVGAGFDLTATLQVGAERVFGQTINGKLADVRVWNDVRTAAEIAANKDAQLTGSEANLQHYWKFETGNTLADSDIDSGAGDTTANLTLQGNAAIAASTNPLTIANSAITVTTTSPEYQVNTTTALDQQYARIIPVEDGGYVIMWQHNNGTDWDIMGQRYDAAGEKFGGEFAVASGASGQALYLYNQIEALPNGGFVVTWHDNATDGNGWTALATIYNASGTAVASNIQLNTYTTDEQGHASMAVISNGDLLFVWQSLGQDAAGGYGVYAQRFDSTGVKIGGETLINTTTAGSQYQPIVVSLDTGGYAVFWSDDSAGAGTQNIMGRFFDYNGTQTVAEFTVNTVTAGAQYFPKAAVLNNGNIVLTWADNTADGSGHGIYATILNSSGGIVTAQFMVPMDGVGEQGISSVAALDGGGFVITWHEHNGTDYDILGQIFNASGAKVGGEIAINTYTTGEQSFASVIPQYDGGFIATWQSNGQDGAGFGIYSQRFDADGNAVGRTTLTGDAAANAFNIAAGQMGLIIDGAGGTDSVVLNGITANTNTIKVSNVESVTGSAGRDIVLMGNVLANSTTFDLGAGKDAIKLADGANTNSFTNVEEVIGGTGNDAVTILTTFVQADKAWFNGEGGTDSLTLTAGNDYFSAETFETIDGGAGTDTLAFENSGDIQGVTLTNVETVAIDYDNTTSSTLNVSAATVFTAGTTITGTGGNDGISSKASMDLTNVTLSGISNIWIDSDSGTANNVGAVLTLNATALPSGISISGSGDDIIQAAGATLDLSAAALNGISSIKAAASGTTITGTTGNNVILGGAANDILIGKNGIDTMTGGGGADIFTYFTSGEGGDTITDFAAATDKLYFAQSGFTSTTALNSTLNVADFTAGANTTSGNYFAFDTTTNKLYYDADAAGVGASVLIATLNMAITETDIVIA